MRETQKITFLGPIKSFQARQLPEIAQPVGYTALIEAFSVEAPLPRKLFAIGERHRVIEEGGWRILTPRHRPEASLAGHLSFALKYEGLDLAVLKRLFLAVGAEPIKAIVEGKSTGVYSRRIWFLFEWLTGERVDLPDCVRGKYDTVMNTDLQYGVDGVALPRYRLRNNLPGNPDFCPLVFRTSELESFLSEDLSARVKATMAKVPHRIRQRTAAFLLLKDSRSSYVLEGESPPQDRIQRWGRALGMAGQQPLSLEELLRLQKIIIGDARFVSLGLRNEFGFVGSHDRESRLPLPDHISAKPGDLSQLLNGMLKFDGEPRSQLDPVLSAACLSFGFVYTHPFEDGNGRLHRYLIHHVLAKQGYHLAGTVFPVSAVILERIEEYREVLETYSKRLLEKIEWESTESFNVRVLNETGDFYRFFDATPHAEFLFRCIKQAIEIELPNETRFLQNFEEFRSRVEMHVEMPERTVDLLFRFLKQNGGRFSKRAKEKEFSQLADSEMSAIEGIYWEIFELDSNESL